MATFYTALYHALLGPTLLSDADGSFLSTDGVVRRSRIPLYSTFSLWDTYRAQHPLLNLLHPRLARDVAESLLLKAEDAEHSTVESLPRWQLFGMETFCMRRRPRPRAGAAGPRDARARAGPATRASSSSRTRCSRT